MSQIRSNLIHWYKNEIAVVQINMRNMKIWHINNFLIIKQDIQIQCPNKISAKMIKGCDAEAACRELSEYYDIIRHESGSGIAGTTIELVPKGFNKAVGISAVCRLFDIPWEDTIVFGDSNNDLAMFEYAAVKVAMGNGSEKIKALADHITQDMFHYGIRNGLEYLKLI